jgi:hypothetical protein
MSNSHGFSTSSMLLAATVLGATGLLTVPIPAEAKPPIPLAPQCDAFAFPASFRVEQNDFWVVTIPGNGKELQGVASASGPGGARITGLVVGGLTGINSVDFTINWDNGHRSRYTGAVQPNGNVTGGRQDVRADGAGPDNTRWGTGTPLVCTAAAAPPAQKQEPPKEQPPQEPAPAGLGTLEVVIPTDVFDAPDGKGNEVGVPLPFARDVQIIGEGCRDNWCNVAVPEAPGGVGWVYQPHFRKL